MWELPHPDAKIRELSPLLHRFMSLLASRPTGLLLGSGLTMDSSFRPAFDAATILNASFLTLATNSNLANERVFTPGTGLDITDAGAGSTLTLDIDLSEFTAENGWAAGDTIPFTDISASDVNRKGTVQALMALTDQFNARMQRDSTTQVSLQYYKGRYIEVNGEIVDVTSSGLTLATTDNLLSSTGTDSAGAMGTSTLYYVYVSNSQASFAPTDLRASATAPSSHRGSKYLGTSGNAANWRFVGWVRTNGSTQFTDSTTDRLVVNYYNRIAKNILLQPAYSDGNSATSWTTTSTTWTAANGGTGSAGSYIATGEDAVHFAAHSLCQHSGATDNSLIGIGDNSTTTAYAEALHYGSTLGCASCTFMAVPAEGYRTVNLLCVTSAATATFYADDGRNGSATDPRGTYLEGVVMA